MSDGTIEKERRREARVPEVPDNQQKYLTFAYLILADIGRSLVGRLRLAACTLTFVKRPWPLVPDVF